MVSGPIGEYLLKNGDGETQETLAAKQALKHFEFDGSHPITDYFISSSHNTYLLANQLWGSASPKAYTEALSGHYERAPARCVEIDAWSGPKEPVVTHGHTFTGSIPFKGVCEAIGDAVGPNDLPVFVSLECHVVLEKQNELVDIMEQTWGKKLLSKPLDQIDTNKVSPNDLRGHIVLMVEWYPPTLGEAPPLPTPDNDDDDESSSDSDFSDNEGSKMFKEYRSTHKKNKTKINERLAALGIYANSIKPTGEWLLQELAAPLHALINISESALLKLIPKSSDGLIAHSQKHLRRCYPRGTRVQSSNVDPLPIWRCGTQVVGLNMQIWDKGMKMNSALFSGTQGWVLKPASLRGGSPRTGTATLKISIIGGDDIPHPSSAKGLATYLIAKLYSPAKKFEWRSKTIKNHGGDPFWEEQIEWTYPDSDLVFVQVKLWQDQFGRDEEVASFNALVDRLEKGLRYWPLVDRQGLQSLGRLLVRVE